MTERFWPISGAIAVLASLVLTWQVHGRTGDETFLCADVSECALGSGWSWMLTGATLTGPFLALAGAAWERRQHYLDRLGPFAHRAIPDGQQIGEVLGVLVAGLLSYWLVRNGPSIEPATPLDIGRLNRWALDVRNFRLEDGATQITTVPSRLSWFLVGGVFFAPFALSFGTMLGREFYGRRRRKAQQAVDSGEASDHNDPSSSASALGDSALGDNALELDLREPSDELDFGD